MDRRTCLRLASVALAAHWTALPAASAGDAPTVGSRIDALLAATGGRAAWAAARGYRVEARHYLAAEPAPFANRILFDFARPRVRIESSPAAGWRARILDGDAGWRLTRDGQRALDAAEVADDLGFWRGNVYRCLHRLAARDAALSARLGDDDRLEIAEQGKPLLWFRQNLAGEPIAFGPASDPQGTIFGPLVAFGPLRFPGFSVRDGGRWRAIIDHFEVDPDLAAPRLRDGVKA